MIENQTIQLAENFTIWLKWKVNFIRSVNYKNPGWAVEGTRPSAGSSLCLQVCQKQILIPSMYQRKKGAYMENTSQLVPQWQKNHDKCFTHIGLAWKVRICPGLVRGSIWTTVGELLSKRWLTRRWKRWGKMKEMEANWQEGERHQQVWRVALFPSLTYHH